MTSEITLALPPDDAARLRKEFDQFIGVSTGLDREFLPPEFNDFLRARLLQHDGPLTERAVNRLLSGGEYGWARRVFDKQLPNALAALMRDAQRFGFGLAVQPDWNAAQRLAHAREWPRRCWPNAGLTPPSPKRLRPRSRPRPKTCARSRSACAHRHGGWPKACASVPMT